MESFVLQYKYLVPVFLHYITDMTKSSTSGAVALLLVKCSEYGGDNTVVLEYLYCVSGFRTKTDCVHQQSANT